MNLRNPLIAVLFLFSFLVISCGDSGNVQNGLGKASLPDGSVYEGEFRNGLYNGNGEIAFPDGYWGHPIFLLSSIKCKFLINELFQ